MTWDQLKREFLDKYFPSAKYFARKMEISSFKQQEGDVLYDAWEMFNILLKRCLGHKFYEMDIMQAFTTGLTSDTQMLLDASAWGTIKIKRAGEIWELIDNLSLNEYHAHTDEEVALKKKGIEAYVVLTLLVLMMLVIIYFHDVSKLFIIILFLDSLALEYVTTP